ncbi:hypothetical protein QVD17_09881 [Tagetes erecta]|uniref:SWIM-type domain-containing protein n=1 Tax=Tagetes erecta TaxID=13708 RepID=A0AAD8P4C7_TARER|nr:hypothetical protein QVD17_09881 [Tagetes erecta]
MWNVRDAGESEYDTIEVYIVIEEIDDIGPSNARRHLALEWHTDNPWSSDEDVIEPAGQVNMCAQEILNVQKNVVVEPARQVEHVVDTRYTKLSTYFQSPDNACKVVIEEIDDIGPSNARRHLALEWHTDNPWSSDEDVIEPAGQVNMCAQEILNVQKNVVVEPARQVEHVVDTRNEQIHDLGYEMMLNEKMDIFTLLKTHQPLNGSDLLIIQHLPNSPLMDDIAFTDYFLSGRDVEETGIDVNDIRKDDDDTGRDVDATRMDVDEDTGSDDDDTGSGDDDVTGSDDDTGSDSDYIVDKDNMVKDVDVDMDEYRAAVEMGVEVDIEHEDGALNETTELDMDAFDSAKNMALHKLHGDYNTQYEFLRDYCHELVRANPGTTVKIDVEREPNSASESRQFRRIYICFGATKAGFKAAGRDLLGLDGSFMKGPYPGQILTAVGVDSNNGIYPVAFAVVEAETLSSWTWFLELLGDDLDLHTNSNFTFISDRQKGIIPALKNVFPVAEHRYCLRHIHENMKSNWRGHIYRDLLWKCASATTVPQFEKAMEKVRKQDPSLHDWLKEIPPHHWSRAYFSVRPLCDLLLNNICEVFNKQLVGGRDKPIISCLEYIREYMMKRIIGVHNLIADEDGPLTPAAKKLFDLIKTEAAQYNVTMAGVNKFQVSGPWNDQVLVDLGKKTCSCRKWELTGMPCKHAVAAILDSSKRDNQDAVPESWVSKVYWLETWKEVYQHTIDPVNGRDMWRPSGCPTILRAPKHHVQVGRPKKMRRKSAVELSEISEKNGKMVKKGYQTSCSICKNKGHNKRSCKGQGGSQVGSKGGSQGGSKDGAHGGSQGGSGDVKKGYQTSCSICKKKGHNKRSCKGV